MIRIFLLMVIGFAVACGNGAEPDTLHQVQPWQVDTAAAVPSPPLVGQISGPAYVHDTFIRDGIAFLCAWDEGLMIYDVGNGMKGGSPSSPVLISTVLTNLNGVPRRAVHNAWWFHNPVSHENRYVFVGQEGSGTIGASSTGDIHVVDLSDIDHPVEVAFYHMATDPPAGTHNFWMDEEAQVLFAAYYNGGVVALDVSGTLSGDLANREIARFKPAPDAYAWGVQQANNSLYVVDMVEGLYQLTFTNGGFTLAGGGGNVPDRYGSDLWVNAHYAYTGTWGGGVHPGNTIGNAIKIWGLDATGSPSLRDSMIFAGFRTVSDVKGTSDGKVLIASAENGAWAGLYVFSLADPARPLLVGRVKVGGGLHTAKIAEINGRLYAFGAKTLSNTPPQVMIFDITDLH